MKKTLVLLLIVAFCIGSVFTISASAEVEGVKSYYTIDAKSGYVIDGKNIESHLPIASMVKIMTALIGFEKVEKGAISFTDEVTISENASGMGGSQMFLEAGDVYKIEDLFKGIIVVSANDACVQLAEIVSGSEESFVKLMNEKAKSLGMNDTNFVNCTGLPANGQYSCAKDVAVMLKELVGHKDYHKFSKIWIEDFKHPDGRVTQFVNTNKLVRFYKDCTGGKTGFTSEAGFCLAASARRGNTDIISVVIGAQDSKTRFETIKSQFESAFANYESTNVLKPDSIQERVSVIGGKSDSVSVMPEKPYFVFSKKGEKGNCKIEVSLDEKVKAPIKKGQKVGTIKVTDGTKTKEIALVSTKDVEALSYLDITQKIAKNWD